jgi:hypothetical protein
MKKLTLSALSAAVLALCACADSGGAAPVPTPEFTTTRTSDAAPVGRSFELRLQGSNAESYGAVLVPIRSLEVSTPAGEPLPVCPMARTVDLTAEGHAYLVGYFFVPEEVSAVKVKLTFDDAGAWEQGGSAGTLDTRVAPVSFEAPVDSLVEHGRAVLLLDVGRSLQPTSQTDWR